ncbi:MAG: ATP-binding cassette domain-containing protein, partial [Acidobacteria bacterium]
MAPLVFAQPDGRVDRWLPSCSGSGQVAGLVAPWLVRVLDSARAACRVRLLQERRRDARGPDVTSVDLEVRHVSKRYRIGDAQARRGWAERARRALQRREHDFWALRDVTFEVERGETFGIIGRNGAGKSTLMKLLSRITVPTEGEIRILGRLVALIELGSGFHPELTGRENVYLSGSILG